MTGKKVTDIREALREGRSLLKELEFEQRFHDVWLRQREEERALREKWMQRMVRVELWLWRLSTLAWALTTFVWWWRSRHG